MVNTSWMQIIGMLLPNANIHMPNKRISSTELNPFLSGVLAQVVYNFIADVRAKLLSEFTSHVTCPAFIKTGNMNFKKM